MSKNLGEKIKKIATVVAVAVFLVGFVWLATVTVAAQRNNIISGKKAREASEASATRLDNSLSDNMKEESISLDEKNESGQVENPITPVKDKKKTDNKKSTTDTPKKTGSANKTENQSVNQPESKPENKSANQPEAKPETKTENKPAPQHQPAAPAPAPKTQAQLNNEKRRQMESNYGVKIAYGNEMPTYRGGSPN